LVYLIGVVKAESKENIDSRAKRPIYAVLTLLPLSWRLVAPDSTLFGK
jgi:hypothetical protein